eukprot:c20615_g1_i1.p1 GENE.c20615_g1_i1~~c20615_g1_i1.p1  ORF type:complete len:480 (-),score=147.67 c20615_g1_i1:54-1493(-)
MFEFPSTSQQSTQQPQKQQIKSQPQPQQQVVNGQGFTSPTSSNSSTSSSSLPGPITESKVAQNQFYDNNYSSSSSHNERTLVPEVEVYPKITWNSPASSVEVAFALDWTTQYPMTKEGNSKFFLKTELPYFEIVEFKFIVDGVWQVSSEYPVRVSGSNTNNAVLPVYLEWKGKADQVRVCFDHEMKQIIEGSVDVTNVGHAMAQIGDDHFIFAENLKHFDDLRFKFLVDGSWQTSVNYETENVARVRQPEEAPSHESVKINLVESNQQDQNERYQPKQQNNERYQPQQNNEQYQPQNEGSQNPHYWEESDDFEEFSIRYTGSAQSVDVRCSVSEWKVDHPLQQVSENNWEGTIHARSFNPFEFKFVLNKSNWVASPDYPIITSGNNPNNIAVPILIKWFDGGNDVKVATSLDNFVVLNQMTYLPQQNVHQFTTLAPSQQFSFKFIIDGNWRVSYTYPTKETNGIENNIFPENFHELLNQ